MMLSERELLNQAIRWCGKNIRPKGVLVSLLRLSIRFLDEKGVKRDLKLINSGQLMDRILYSLNHELPCSVVSVDQTEAFVMAQYKIYSEKEILSHGEAKRANRGVKEGFNHRGIRFPNVKARDETVEAVRNAHIVG